MPAGGIIVKPGSNLAGVCNVSDRHGIGGGGVETYGGGYGGAYGGCLLGPAASGVIV